MLFSKSRCSTLDMFFARLMRLSLVLVVLFVSACATFEKQEEVPEEVVEAAEGEEAAEPVFVLIPNPYVPGNVPTQARQEFANIKALMQARKWGEAKSSLQLMTETYPALSGPYINLGIVHHQLGEHEEAEKALKFAIETNPQNFDAYTRLGLLYRETGRFTDAEAIYLQALELWPHHLDSTTNLGILYDLYMGRLDEALAYYELSQQIVGGEDRQLKGWIADLKRRLR